MDWGLGSDYNASTGAWAGKRGAISWAQSNAAIRPDAASHVCNGVTGVAFASADRLEASAVSLGAHSLVVVGYLSGGTDGQFLVHGAGFAGAGTDGAFFQGGTAFASRVARGGTISDRNLAASWGKLGSARVLAHVYGGTHATHKIFIEGTEATYTAGGSTGDPGTGAVSAVLTMGDGPAGGWPMIGTVFGWAVYSGALSAAEVERVRAFFASRLDHYGNYHSTVALKTRIAITPRYRWGDGLRTIRGTTDGVAILKTDQTLAFSQHRAVFDLTAGIYTVEIGASYTPTDSATKIGVRLDGVDATSRTLTVTATSGTEQITLDLSDIGAGTHRVELISPPVLGSGGAYQGGWFLRNLFVPAGSTCSIVQPPEGGQRICLVGDSIITGYDATTPAYESLGSRLHPHFADVFVDAWSSRRLIESTDSGAGGVAGFCAQIAACSPSIVWIELGTNDFGNQIAGTRASFQSRYASVLTTLRALLPSAEIYCQSPLPRAVETGAFFDLPDLRDDIQTAVTNAADPAIYYVDGTAIMDTGDMDDGLHPTTAGFALYATYLLAEVGVS